MKNLILLVGAPRSGTTYLQRLLMCSEDIESVAEPWILLHIFSMFDPKSITSYYGHYGAVAAYRDFVANSAYEDTDAFIRDIVEVAYSRSHNGKKHFLDKTPRYIHILEQIARALPDAKVIFITRHPAEICRSINDTWGNGNFFSFHFYSDVVRSLEVISRKSMFPQFLFLAYEDLTRDRESLNSLLGDVESYIGVNSLQQAIDKSFCDQSVPGRMGDPNRFTHTAPIFNRSNKSRITIFDWLMLCFIRNVKLTKIQRNQVEQYFHRRITPSFKCISVSKSVLSLPSIVMDLSKLSLRKIRGMLHAR